MRRGLWLVTAGTLAASAHAQAGHGDRLDYAPAVEALQDLITHELTAKDIPGMSIALVDDQAIVWAAGFGQAAPGVAAPTAIRFRAGPVSTLFTAVAVMQLAERGLVVLDAPVSRYVPEFAPHNRFGTSISVRHLLTHRAGLPREPPRGHAADVAAPSLAATVMSLNDVSVVFPPGARTKYSSAGPTVLGRLIERVTGEPFEVVLRQSVLEPSGMLQSAFVPPGGRDTTLATAVMWAPDGRRFPAPTFPLGTGPANELHTTATDLGRFLTVLFAGGRTLARTSLLTSASLSAMWEAGFADTTPGEHAGIGFLTTIWDGHRRVGQHGAVYGHTAHVAALPDDHLGVVVLANRDEAGAVVSGIADAALRAMLAVRAGRRVAPARRTGPVPPALAARLAGRFAHRARVFEVRDRPSGLLLAGSAAGVPLELRTLGDTLVVDDVRQSGPWLLPIDAGRTGVVIAGDTFARVSSPRPAPLPARWAQLLGEYGWDHSVLFVYESEGQLHVLIDWLFAYAVEERARDVFAFPDTGRYGGERLEFLRAADTAAVAVAVSGVRYPRRRVGPADGRQLRVTPNAPVATVLATARRASPPAQPDGLRAPDLVELVALDSTIRLDIRYATAENFLGAPFYSAPRAFLQRPAAIALVQAHRWLARQGYGVLVHDGYRPWYVTKAFWDATPPDRRWLVADPSSGSRHNRGCAVDVSLVDLRTGAVVDMGGTYDETTPRSYPDYPATSALQRWHRELLRTAFTRAGFRAVADEWWHFDFRDWQAYPVMNVGFEELEVHQ